MLGRELSAGCRRLLTGLTLGGFLTLGAAAHAAPLPGVFKGDAYGSITTGVSGALGASLHKAAYKALQCGGTNGQTLQATHTGMSVGTNGDLLTTGPIVSTLFTEKTDIAARMLNTSTVNGVSLFGGRVTASLVKAVAKVDGNAGKVVAVPTGSDLEGLTVEGVAVGSDPAPGSTWPLAGIGTLIANKVTITGAGRNTQIVRVDMLTVEVSETNEYNLPPGSRLIIGHAQGSFNRTVRETFIASQSWVGHETGALLEAQGFLTMPCDGNGGTTKTVQATLFKLPGIDIASGTTTGAGGPEGATGTFARGSSTARNGSLLGGRITFASITVAAEHKFNGSVHQRSTAGTQFTGLKIDGISYPSPARNALHILLPGYGVVHVNEQVVPGPASRARTKLNGLRVVITETPNALGLAAGTEMFVAHTEITATR
jgi:hypothetical protein